MIYQNTVSGILLILMAALGWSALGSLTLALSPIVSPLGISSIRGFWLFLAFGVLLWRQGLKLTCTRATLLAGASYAFSGFTYIKSLSLLPIAVAAPLHYMTPTFLLLGMMLLYARIPRPIDLIGVSLSLIGATILMTIGGNSSLAGVIWALLSAISWALYLGMLGSFTVQEKYSVVFLGGVFLAAMGLSELNWRDWTLATWPILIALGICSSILPLLFLAWASKTVSPVSVSLILLIEPAFAAGMAAFFNQQYPTPLKFVGLSLVVLGAGCGVGRGAIPAVDSNQARVPSARVVST